MHLMSILAYTTVLHRLSIMHLLSELHLQVTEYNQLSVHDRALILEGLVTIVANTELLRNHLRHLEPEGATPVLNRGAVMGQDSAGNIYHQLGGPSARWGSSRISSRPKWSISLVIVASNTM